MYIEVPILNMSMEKFAKKCMVGDVKLSFSSSMSGYIRTCLLTSKSYNIIYNRKDSMPKRMFKIWIPEK